MTRTAVPVPKAPLPGMKGPPPAAPPARRVIANREVRDPRPRLIFYASEKFGKTTFAAHAPDPIILMARGETGYDELLAARSVPQVPAAIVESWTDLEQWIDQLADNPEGRKTLVLDALGGFDLLCQEHVAETEFGGDMGERGFAGFGRGTKLCVNAWARLCQKLDRLRDKTNMTIVLVAHSRTKTFNDPLGPAFERYEPDMDAKAWPIVAKWSDQIIFGKFESIVETTKAQAGKNIAERKGKGIGGTSRVLFTQGCDAYVAGGRYSLDPRIDLPDDDIAAPWRIVWEQINRVTK